MKNKQSRIFSIKEQLKLIHYGAKGFVLLKISRKKRLMNKKLKERIMLAVTEVNGCTMCSFVHTHLALSSGMSREVINEILAGDYKNIPIEDSVAVIFAQHYAFSKEMPSDESIERLVDEYGFKKAELVIAACNMITMTNGMGTSMDYFYNRLRFKRNRSSNLMLEILNPILTMIFFPLLVVYNYITSFFTNIKILSLKYQTQ